MNHDQPCHEPDLDLDALRAWAEGTLAPEARRALEARLARDPQAAQLAQQLRAAQLFTEPLRTAVPPSRLEFSALALDAERPRSQRPWRWVAGAAAAVLVAGAVWLGARPGEGPTPAANVRLTTITLTGAEPSWPAPLTAGYRPVREGSIAWFDDAEAAARLARFTGRRVLLYVHYVECPLCQTLESTALSDPGVLASLERVVPLRLDAARLPEAEVQQIMRAGWPYLALREADGKVVTLLPVRAPALELQQALDAALDAALDPALAAGPPPAPWEQSEARASALAATLYARRALLQAREQAATDPAEARGELARAARQAAGTPAGDDLTRVLSAWSAGAPFPILEEPSR